MPLYEKRTYQVALGKMPEMLKHETSLFEALEQEGLAAHCVGYFVSDCVAKLSEATTSVASPCVG